MANGPEESHGIETSFIGALITEEPPMSPAQRSLMSLSRSFSFGQRNAWWSAQGIKDYELSGIEPHGVREQVAGVLGDLLTPMNAQLVVSNWYGRPLRLDPRQGSHLSHVTLGFTCHEVPAQRVLLNQDAEALIGINGISFEPVDDDHVRAIWEDKVFRSHDWHGSVALAFWYKEGRPDQYFAGWQDRRELSERIELSSWEHQRGVSPLLTPKVGTPEWGGPGTEAYAAEGLEPRQATEEEALALLGIVRQIAPEYWQRQDQQNRQYGAD